MKYSTPISIGQVIRIHAWLDNNPQADVQPLEVMPADDADLVLAGLPVAMNTEIQDPLQPAHTLLLAITLLSGLFLGTSVTSVALTYTGAYPVNLLLLLAILVGLPGLTLMLSIIARLFGRKQSPSLGAVITWSLGRLNQDHADFLSANLWRYGSCLYWHTQRYFQYFTLTFLSAGFLTFLSLITFTDIAFGWSSTLQVQANTVFNLTEFLSLPWKSWLPIAHPSLELVESSRFFRMNPDNNAALLGRWWPFIGMCVLVWGIGPRTVMAWIARRRIRATTRAALLNHAEVTALISRLKKPNVTFENNLTIPAEHSEPDIIGSEHVHANADATIAWNGADSTATDTVHVGVWVSKAEQIEQLSRLPSEAARIRIVVKGWEPPLLEFLDFVQSVRDRTGPDTDIVILPTALRDQPLDANDLTAWRSTLAKLHDVKVYVEEAA